MAGVPDLTLDDLEKPQISFDDFRAQTEEVITESDRKLLFYFYLKTDCINLVRMLKKPEVQLTQFGNLTEEQLKDLITSARTMNFNVHRYPAFMSIFAREYDYNKDKPNFFAKDKILFDFYQFAIQCPNKFISEWYKLNLNLTNTKDFDLRHEYDYVADIMNIVDTDNPVDKERLIDAFKWNWLDEATFFDVFSIEAVFAYLCKLEIIDRWQHLEPEIGQARFKEIIENLRAEAKVPEEFVRK